jgi:hypothetical protein
MSYDTKKLEIDAVELIAKDPSVVFKEEVAMKLGISKSTYYDKGLHESDVIDNALTNNKFNIKNKLRKRWVDSDNATLQSNLYKLISTDEEAHRLNGSKQEIKQEVVNHSTILEELESDEEV